MTRLCSILLLLAGLARAAPPPEPGPVIVAGENDAAWRPLFTALANKGTIHSQFREHRWFPFRKQAVVLEGEMRLAPGRGLSLRYVKPEESLVIVDERGLLLRDATGAPRELPADPRAGAVNAALLPILRFDEAEFAKVFLLHAARDGGEWRLDFVPRDPALARTLGRIVLHGADEVVCRIEFRRSATQRVEILIGETATGVTFSEADLQRFFR
jgi:hypothetical protein